MEFNIFQKNGERILEPSKTYSGKDISQGGCEKSFGGSSAELIEISSPNKTPSRDLLKRIAQEIALSMLGRSQYEVNILPNGKIKETEAQHRFFLTKIQQRGEFVDMIRRFHTNPKAKIL